MSGFFLAPAISRPRGAAGVQAQVADSAITGGNARGANAVDWQTSRITASMVASGTLATISGGASNKADGTRAWVPGGAFADTRGNYGRGAWGSGGAAGSAQAGEFVLRQATTDATIARLTSDGAGANTANTINLPNFGTYAGRLIVVAKKVGTTDTAVWHIDVSAVRGTNAASTVLFHGASSAIAPTASNGTVTGWALTVAADTTNGGIAVSGTGAAATSIAWTARFLDAEVMTVS